MTINIKPVVHNVNTVNTMSESQTDRQAARQSDRQK